MNIEERGKALEDAFFAKRNRELLAELRKDLESRGQHEALKEASGIADEALLDRLLALDITAESVAAMSLVPLVLVAWADGKLDPKERQAVISGAAECGVRNDSTAGQLLQSWLDERPDETLKEVWHDYTNAISAGLQPGDFAKLADNVMGRCKQVAEAAGGFLGLGSISKSELEMLAELQEAFG